jgi:hypothetical protein
MKSTEAIASQSGDTAAVGGQRYLRLTASSRSSARSLMIQIVVTMYWKEQKALSTL